jgi:phosphocarrier protein FPr/phosphocarrier protein
VSDLVILSPMQGWASSLDEVPDPVFAERMLGDGLALDPTLGELRAPCDGTVISVHRARHALTLRAANGAEILMHVGLETVALNGEGLEVRVAEGQTVEAGQLLIAFDLDLLARRARSVITPLIVTNGEAFNIRGRRLDRAVDVGDPLMQIGPAEAVADAAAAEAGRRQASREVVVALAHGIHARPAGLISSAAKRFSAEVTLLAHGRRAGARSAVALMGLGVGKGDEISLLASGPDAEAAAAAVADILMRGAGDDDEAPAATASGAVPDDAAAPAEAGTIRGVRAAPGFAVGVAVRIQAPDVHIEETGGGMAHEAAELDRALGQVAGRLQAAAAASGPHRRSILQAHVALIADPELIGEARSWVERGKSAGYAWRAAIARHAAALRALGDRRMADRVDDLVDLERQVLLALAGEAQAPQPVLPERAVLIADELLPSQLIQLDPARVAGLATAAGGPTSHVAILAASMGVPALVAMGPEVLEIAAGSPVVLDADAGWLRPRPDAEALANAEAELARRRARREETRSQAARDCRMADGARIEVFANLASVADARTAVENGAEGCGLLRTEFLFLSRDTAPSEDEQAQAYEAIADVLDGRPLIIRTLDIGSDKPAPYLPLPHEDNPALGLRGVRASLWRQDLLRTQLRAILRLRRLDRCRIMLPMVAMAEEVAAVRAILNAERAALGIEQEVELGAMVETPASAVSADLIAAEARFLSIGTNDLTQYVLAMDRGHAQLAARLEGLHPAVLRLINATADGARRRGRWLGVCGGMASDLVAVPLLIGLGVTELSATPGLIPEIKALVRTLTFDACRALALEALQQESASAVRKLVLSRAGGGLKAGLIGAEGAAA